MGMWIGRNRKARVTYGFDEIALVPGDVTINPEEVDTRFRIPGKDGDDIELRIPVIASAMDGVTDVRFCTEMDRLGGLGVILSFTWICFHLYVLSMTVLIELRQQR